MVPLAFWEDSLSVGDAIVGAGALLLAGFTYRLGRATYALDDRNAARARMQRERAVRGVARLVDGELGVTQASITAALGGREWHRFYVTPHGAWDRDGALIAEWLPEDEAEALIEFFARLTAWERLVGLRQTVMNRFQLGEEQVVVSDLSARLEAARGYLRPVAYPDARDLERDPDGYPIYRRGRRRRRTAEVRRGPDERAPAGPRCPKSIDGTGQHSFAPFKNAQGEVEGARCKTCGGWQAEQ